MKLVIVADIHANYEALSSFPETYDELWVLGDLVNYGADPSAAVDFVRSRAGVAVRGNHDHAVGYDEDSRCIPRYRAMAEATRRFTESALTGDQREFLRRLPIRIEVEREGTRFHLCHAMPSDPLYGYCPRDSDLWVAEVEATAADVLLVGHTHTPFVRKIRGRLLVNPGSIGQPKAGKPDACYAVWENGAVTLKTFPYAVQRTAAKIDALPISADVRRDLISVLRTGSP